MFKKLLNKIGIGTASVNLVLNNPQIRVGDEVVGTLHIKGGSSETKANGVIVELQLHALVGEGEDHKEIEQVVDSVVVTNELTVPSGDEMAFPFRFAIPVVPHSTKFVKYTFNTRLDIPGAVDKYDFDDVVIYPYGPVAVLFEALNSLGFHEYDDSGEYNGHVQKFEFKPAGGQFKGHVEELEFTYVIEEEGVRLYVELDRRAQGHGGFFRQEVEQLSSVFFGYATLESREQTMQALFNYLQAELQRGRHEDHHSASHSSHGHHEHHSHHEHHEHHSVVDSIASAAAGVLVAEMVEEAVEEVVEHSLFDAIVDAAVDNAFEDYNNALDDIVEEMEESEARMNAIADEMEELSEEMASDDYVEEDVYEDED